MTVRHVVLTRFKASVTAAERQSAFDELAALRGHLNGIEAMAFGPNVSPEGLGQGFAHGFTIDFADATARDAYLVDEAHGRAGGRLVSMLEGGIAGLVVFDIDA
jgi:hypothetical protein